MASPPSLSVAPPALSQLRRRCLAQEEGLRNIALLLTADERAEGPEEERARQATRREGEHKAAQVLLAYAAQRESSGEREERSADVLQSDVARGAAAEASGAAQKGSAAALRLLGAADPRGVASSMAEVDAMLPAGLLTGRVDSEVRWRKGSGKGAFLDGWFDVTCESPPVLASLLGDGLGGLMQACESLYWSGGRTEVEAVPSGDGCEA
jgi:hypothetical protein